MTALAGHTAAPASRRLVLASYACVLFPLAGIAMACILAYRRRLGHAVAVLSIAALVACLYSLAQTPA
jgi:hypothetical protein